MATDDQQHPDDPAAAVERAADVLAALWTASQHVLETRVSASQFQALTVIARHGKVNLNGLAEAMGAIPSSASRLCDRLQAAGFVTRSESSHSRREVELTLTRSGRALMAEVGRLRRQEITRILAGMSPADRLHLLLGLTGFARAAESDADDSRERPA
ncbi:MarR family winged helix-turn-helix transcriptional regulator [Saccharothrix longispora]|uniref:MarR family winged helix-turn-helix transcriptional regulator n=1 Tax=Saccharothrix longispora TaxID=33920 RepID=UPI0028FD0D6F|nr:MarR family transcriptional regulator [Saccharothrix longispora]MBY8850407.1 MarR family transcriptional regulator [Saccharothrix sp. MB29]MDU0293502.1 MarR family transcriptional regulator [Saccharothrix longispora]